MPGFDRPQPARQSGAVLLWSGFALILCGLACFAIDRRAVHYFHAAVPRPFERVLHSTTDWAKGALWLTASIAALAGAWLFQAFRGPDALSSRLMLVSGAFLASLAVASIVLHSIKILLGRRRPRDELELNLYGFRPFTFDLRSDSFPSGHALTIFCVAVVLAAAIPALAVLWFAIAVWLALTRALLNSHFVSDVFVGAGIALVTTREVLLNFFPSLALPWF
ncbi:MAG TPA: phosphatase PAP2 family protein [Rhizomicrobium sp.]|nr:phosphatase PAP2 family protein [Rhizomicrobium sp.]